MHGSVVWSRNPCSCTLVSVGRSWQEGHKLLLARGPGLGNILFSLSLSKHVEEDGMSCSPWDWEKIWWWSEWAAQVTDGFSPLRLSNPPEIRRQCAHVLLSSNLFWEFFMIKPLARSSHVSSLLSSQPFIKKTVEELEACVLLSLSPRQKEPEDRKSSQLCLCSLLSCRRWNVPQIFPVPSDVCSGSNSNKRFSIYDNGYEELPMGSSCVWERIKIYRPFPGLFYSSIIVLGFCIL